MRTVGTCRHLYATPLPGSAELQNLHRKVLNSFYRILESVGFHIFAITFANEHFGWHAASSMHAFLTQRQPRASKILVPEWILQKRIFRLCPDPWANGSWSSLTPQNQVPNLFESFNFQRPTGGRGTSGRLSSSKAIPFLDGVKESRVIHTIRRRQVGWTPIAAVAPLIWQI